MLPDRPRAWYAYVAAVVVLALVTYAPGQVSAGAAAALWTAQLPVSLVAAPLTYVALVALTGVPAAEVIGTVVALGIAAVGAVANAELGRLVLRRLRRA